MGNDSKPRFEIRKADDGVYHVVQVFGAGATLVIHQTLHSTLEDAELWLKAIEEVVSMANKSNPNSQGQVAVIKYHRKRLVATPGRRLLNRSNPRRFITISRNRH